MCSSDLNQTGYLRRGADLGLGGGMALMRDDGERLVREGITSREELVRVTRE